MVQTGDPTGTGMGGESIWGGEFEDEFHATLRHDRPYTLSMANGGPGTNGSQFFLTVVPTVSHLPGGPEGGRGDGSLGVCSLVAIYYVRF